MKTSQKEGVSDRPPNAHDLPRHEAPQLGGGGWCQFGANGRRSSQFGYSRCSQSAPASDAAHCVFSIVVDVDTRMTNCFLSHRLLSVHAQITSGFSVRAVMRDGVDGLRVCSVDGGRPKRISTRIRFSPRRDRGGHERRQPVRRRPPAGSGPAGVAATPPARWATRQKRLLRCRLVCSVSLVDSGRAGPGRGRRSGEACASSGRTSPSSAFRSRGPHSWFVSRGRTPPVLLVEVDARIPAHVDDDPVDRAAGEGPRRRRRGSRR